MSEEKQDKIEELCGCSICGVTLKKSDDLVQNPVYKHGELQCIELAHRSCVPEWDKNDKWFQ